MRNHPLLLALVLALAACGCGGGSGGAAAPVPQPQPPEVPPFGLDRREALATLSLPGETGSGEGFDVVRAFPNLTFTQPLFLAGVPCDSRIDAVEGLLHRQTMTAIQLVGKYPGSQVTV